LTDLLDFVRAQVLLYRVDNAHRSLAVREGVSYRTVEANCGRDRPAWSRGVHVVHNDGLFRRVIRFTNSAAKPAQGERMAANDDTRKADFSDVESGSSSTAPTSKPADTERTITVKAGDSLSKIAKRELGDANKWHAIYEANKDRIKNPDLIYPGDVLTLPNA
jgi:LysM repeat protein